MCHAYKSNHMVQPAPPLHKISMVHTAAMSAMSLPKGNELLILQISPNSELALCTQHKFINNLSHIST